MDGFQRFGDGKAVKRKQFCQLSPAAYRLSVARCCAARSIRDRLSGIRFAAQRQEQPLPIVVYRHKSLIRRKLGNVDMRLQENKAVNLALAAPCVNGILIRPGETFSFWRLVGNPTQKRGYREGLTIANARTGQGIGGGMCQFTNLIHWMALHSPLEVRERHHHDGLDLFPDYNRQIPFGTGTSISYNYVDYRLYNPTQLTFQLLVWTTQTYLCGELRADGRPEWSYHVRTEGEGFIQEADGVYRVGSIYRDTIDPRTGQRVKRELLGVNHARVLYDTTGLEIQNNVRQEEGSKR